MQHFQNRSKKEPTVYAENKSSITITAPKQGQQWREDSRARRSSNHANNQVRRLTISTQQTQTSHKVSIVAPTTSGVLSAHPLTSNWVFLCYVKIARAHYHAWVLWQFYLPGRLVNTVNSTAGLCYVDQTGLPRGQTSASHSGPG